MNGNGSGTLADALEPLLTELGSIDRTDAAGGAELRRAGRLFAVLGDERLEVVLDPAIAAAAQRTPDVTSSPRGPGWVSFRPGALDQFALDRAESWLRIAHRGPSAR